MAKSLLPATKLPNIGNTQVTLESDVLVAVFLVVAGVLYFRGIPQALYRAVMTNHDPSNGTGVSPPGAIDNPVFPPTSTGTLPPSATSPAVVPKSTPNAGTPPYASFGGLIVPTSFDPTKFPAGGTLDPQPGGYVGGYNFRIPTFTSCWVFPDGTSIGSCQG